MNAADLDGLVTPEVCEALTRYAAEVPAEQAIVEIGSFKGKSTCALAEGSTGAPVYAVDPWDLSGNISGRFGFAEPLTREAFNRQVRECGHQDTITAMQMFSLDAAHVYDGPPIGLLYIDGNHAEGSVRADYQAWRGHVDSEATVVFDDLDTPRNPGVRRAIESLGLNFDVEADRLAVVRLKPHRITLEPATTSDTAVM